MARGTAAISESSHVVRMQGLQQRVPVERQARRTEPSEGCFFLAGHLMTLATSDLRVRRGSGNPPGLLHDQLALPYGSELSCHRIAYRGDSEVTANSQVASSTSTEHPPANDNPEEVNGAEHVNRQHGAGCGGNSPSAR